MISCGSKTNNFNKGKIETMKKIILTTFALSLSIMSACSTPIGGGLNALVQDLGAKRLTKAQAIKFFDCVGEKATNKSVQLQTAHDYWLVTVNNINDADFGTIMTQEKADSMTKAYGNSACKFE